MILHIQSSLSKVGRRHDITAPASWQRIRCGRLRSPVIAHAGVRGSLRPQGAITGGCAAAVATLHRDVQVVNGTHSDESADPSCDLGYHRRNRHAHHPWWRASCLPIGTSCHSSAETVRQALIGNYREEHLFALAQAIELYEPYQPNVATCDETIEGVLERSKKP